DMGLSKGVSVEGGYSVASLPIARAMPHAYAKWRAGCEREHCQRVDDLACFLRTIRTIRRIRGAGPFVRTLLVRDEPERGSDAPECDILSRDSFE
ncbi:hypothetical protein, partial [Cupriavidus plantarum]|uniref:hypothetical protein n=1 Tax=Cupriavidus plantarum TaxID=942865 RepID=UPI0039EDF61C